MLRPNLILTCAVFAILFAQVRPALADDPEALTPPTIPVGADAYTEWYKWPYQRIGARAYMRSTYDRTGGNRTADASHYLYQLRDDFNVALDVMGQGYLYFARYNHWHGSPWHYEVDGVNHIVQETSTAKPGLKIPDAVFMPEKAFPPVLTYTYATTKGADLSWVPIGFEDRFRMAYSRTFYGTGYFIYHLFAPGANLSRPVERWDAGAPDPRIADLLGSAGSDIAVKYKADARYDGESNTWNIFQEELFERRLQPGQSLTLTTISGPSVITSLKIDLPRPQATAFGNARLRITWDGRKHPSVDAPINLFFGAGTLHNRDNKEYLVKALPVNIRFDADRVHLACYFPMPFFKSAKIELVGVDGVAFDDIHFQLAGVPYDDRPEYVGYFHATYKDLGIGKLGHDHVLLDTDKVEGGGPWSGNFVGTSFIFSENAVLTTLEGDPRFFFDDSNTPQAQGTGTEEWGGGGDYWGGQTMTLPLAGHPVGVRRASDAKQPEELIQSAYRFLLADLMPFGRRAVIQLEHGGRNESVEKYKSVTYWYGAPFATLVETDTLHIGDAESEKSHRYESPDASEPYTFSSRYEWGVDSLPSSARDAPSAEPADYVEFEFEADGDIPYYIWLRGRALSTNNLTDATWLQFDDLIGTDKRHPGHGDKGFGNWLDDTKAGTWSWASGLPQLPPHTITFKQSGKHRLRVQTRHAEHEIDTIWLSASTDKRPSADKSPPAASRDEIVLTAADVKLAKGNIARKQVDGKSILRVGPRSAAERIEVYPEQSVTGRKTTGSSEFELKLDKNNWGVLLRRTLDYQFPNQRAKVFIADVDSANADNTEPEWQPAGTWFLAGSNTCYHSYPGVSGKDRYPTHLEAELGNTDPAIITSNRRLRDDEFLISHKLTRGRDKIRVRVEFEPLGIPLLPGQEVAEQAWSEIAYQCYCWVLPDQTN